MAGRLFKQMFFMKNIKNQYSYEGTSKNNKAIRNVYVSQFSYVLGLIYEIANLKHFSTSRFKTGGRLKSQDKLTEKNAFYKFAKLSTKVFI